MALKFRNHDYEQSTLHFYRVKTKCGHVGRRYYIPIDFAVKARSKSEAATIAKYLPRVKHHHKDAILSVEEITYDEYVMLCNINYQDDYLACGNIQNQRAIEGLDHRLLIDSHFVEKERPKHTSKKSFKEEKFKHKKIRMRIQEDLKEIQEFL